MRSESSCLTGPYRYAEWFPVSTTIPPRADTDTSRGTPYPDLDAPSPEHILDELEPMMAYQRRAMMRFWQDRSLSKMNLHVLMLLEQHGPMPMSRLAGMADVALSNLTGIVDRMEQHRLVDRIRDERDRRVVLVRATHQGRERCAEMEGLRREHLVRLMGALTGSERQVVLVAARALARGVERLDAEGSVEHLDAVGPPGR